MKVNHGVLSWPVHVPPIANPKHADCACLNREQNTVLTDPQPVFVEIRQLLHIASETNLQFSDRMENPPRILLPNLLKIF